MPVSREHCFWVQNRIEAFIDNELCDSELTTFELHVDTCAWCREELSLARTIAGELRSLSTIRCPQSVIEKAAASTALRPGPIDGGRVGNIRTWLERLYRPIPKPAMVAAIVFAFAALLLVLPHDTARIGDIAHPPDYAQVSAEDAQEVADEVALAFSYVNKYTLRTNEVARQGTLLENVMKSAYKTIVESMSPFPIN